MRLVRPDLVEVSSEGIEAALLSTPVAGRRYRGLGLEVFVHAFVTAVLVRGGGLDEVGQNAELDPPDGQARETTQGRGREGRTVVGADPLG